MPEAPEKRSGSPRNGLREFSRLLLNILLCFIGIVVVLAVLAGLFLPTLGRMRPKTVSMDCKTYLLKQANRIILDHYRKEMEKEDSSLSRDSTVSDVIQAIPSDWIARFFYCNGPSRKYPYLVFPAPVSAVAGEPAGEPVPVLMCSPDCFHAKANCGINVLYSDGSVRTIGKNEAEQLVSEYSPVPVELDFEAQPEEGK